MYLVVAGGSAARLDRLARVVSAARAEGAGAQAADQYQQLFDADPVGAERPGHCPGLVESGRQSSAERGTGAAGRDRAENRGEVLPARTAQPRHRPAERPALSQLVARAVAGVTCRGARRGLRAAPSSPPRCLTLPLKNVSLAKCPISR